MVPLLAAWLAAPSVAQALGAPADRRDRRLPPDSRRQALRYALLHWRFFDRFVTAESTWLAPDNFQETPEPVVALRTSPTNVGLQLLATVSAFDLGFVSLDDMLRRLELVFRTLERMRRFRGHLYNWYDLRDLSVMEPAYVSTVDSGNLAGHLIALRQACLALPDGPIVDPRIWHALDTSLALADERLLALPNEVAALEQLRSARAALALAGEPVTAAALGAISAALANAEAALTSARLAPEVLAPAIEWITWSRRLAESQRELLGGFDAAPVESLRRLAPTWADAASFITRLETLADRAATFAMEMDFRFLFDGERKLFAIGFQQTTHSLDGSYYDLLASESRLASFVAIAKNDVPAEHWFRLGRRLTYAAGEPALVSWSGSMFEYLMPMLVMRSFPDTVLAQTCAGALERQVAYGGERNVPWGVSESAYNVRDRHQTYQYRPFGVPDLALKRGLGRELVVAPYASVLATMIDPQRALANLARLEDKGTLGPYGFRDAVDYTRPDDDGTFAVVRTYMAHHMGMGLVALTNTLAGQVWQERFHADPVVRSAELLLHERIPRRLVLQEPQGSRRDESMPEAEIERPAVRELDGPDTANPHVALLGHLPYTIMVSHCGRRVQPLRVARRHPLAIGRHARRVRTVLLREGPRDGPRLVGGAPAGVRAGRLVPGLPGNRPGHLPPRRRRHRDPHRDRRRSRGFCRSAARHADQQRRHAARARAHELRRDRALAARGRPCTPGLRQSLRRDRVARLVLGHHGHAPAALGNGAVALVRACGRRWPGASRRRHL